MIKKRHESQKLAAHTKNPANWCHNKNYQKKSDLYVYWKCSIEASGPQDCSLWSQFCLKRLFLGQQIEILTEIFFIYNFGNPFILSKKRGFEEALPVNLEI